MLVASGGGSPPLEREAADYVNREADARVYESTSAYMDERTAFESVLHALKNGDYVEAAGKYMEAAAKLQHDHEDPDDATPSKPGDMASYMKAIAASTPSADYVHDVVDRMKNQTKDLTSTAMGMMRADEKNERREDRKMARAQHSTA